jgi:hypothetical protein
MARLTSRAGRQCHTLGVHDVDAHRAHADSEPAAATRPCRRDPPGVTGRLVVAVVCLAGGGRVLRVLEVVTRSMRALTVPTTATRTAHDLRDGDDRDAAVLVRFAEHALDRQDVARDPDDGRGIERDVSHGSS